MYIILKQKLSVINKKKVPCAVCNFELHCLFWFAQSLVLSSGLLSSVFWHYQLGSRKGIWSIKISSVSNTKILLWKTYGGPCLMYSNLWKNRNWMYYYFRLAVHYAYLNWWVICMLLIGSWPFHRATTWRAVQVVGDGETALVGVTGLHLRLWTAQVNPARPYSKCVGASCGLVSKL